jgi:hypothetical protein
MRLAVTSADEGSPGRKGTVSASCSILGAHIRLLNGIR